MAVPVIETGLKPLENTHRHDTKRYRVDEMDGNSICKEE